MVPSLFQNLSTQWYFLPALIFCARVADVTLGTLRIIFIGRGQRRLAPVLGFFEVLIWIIAVSQLVNHLTNWLGYLAYASGFATGNYIGMWIENQLALGKLALRVIINQHPADLPLALRAEGYGVTELDGAGSSGPVKVVFTIIPRKDLPKVSQMVHMINPKAFISVEEVRDASEGIFPSHTFGIDLRSRLLSRK